jgi:hypothetical protein
MTPTIRENDSSSGCQHETPPGNAHESFSGNSMSAYRILERGVGVRMRFGRDHAGFPTWRWMLPYDGLSRMGTVASRWFFWNKIGSNSRRCGPRSAIYFLVHGAGAISVNHLLIGREF